MKYKFDVYIENNNYPLIVLYKVKTFSEYGVDITPKGDLVFDSVSGKYKKTVEFSLTNWVDSSGVENYNNLSCIGVNKLTVDVYAFQQGAGDDFAWITPEMLRNPENYDGWETFKTNYVEERTLKPAEKTFGQNTAQDAVYVSVLHITRVAVPSTYFGADDDVQTLSITIQALDLSNNVVTGSSVPYNDLTFTRSEYNPSYFVSDDVNYTLPAACVSTAVKLVATFTGGSSTDFTTTLSNDLFKVGVSRYKIDESIGNTFEVYFSGNNWQTQSFSSFKYTLVFAGGAFNISSHNDNIYLSSSLGYVQDSVCGVHTTTTKSFSAQSFNNIFAINPIYCFVDSNDTFYVKQVDVLNGSTSETFVNYGKLNSGLDPLYYELNT